MAPGRRHPRLRQLRDNGLSGRRSSLRVNLSYVSSLSDSGNGSLKRSLLESNEVTVSKKVCQDQSSAMSGTPENALTCVEAKSLRAIRSKEQTLNQSCELLKDAILQKTREIFDRQAELAVKTTSVLKGPRQALKEINDGSGSVILSKKSVSSKNDSIQTSPSSKSGLVTRNSKNSTKSILEPVARLSKGDVSVILSGSSKSHRKTLPKLSNKVLRVRLTRIADPRLEVSTESSQSSQSSNLDDIGAPMTCSSFISGHGNPGSQGSQRAESEDREGGENRDAEEVVVPTAQTLSPVEITAVQVAVNSEKKSFTRLRRVSSSNVTNGHETTRERSSLREVPMELTTVQSHIPLRGSASSCNSIRTSLNVNTSVNEPSAKKISEEASQDRGCNATRLSLRVNTSLENEEGSDAQKTPSSADKKTPVSITRSTERCADGSGENSTDPMENISLVARLRNISGRKATEDVDKRKSSGSRRSTLGEGPSFVEGTPYPPSRSILWRTQLRSVTLNAIRNRRARESAASVETPKKSSKSSDSDTTVSNEYLTPPNNTVVLGDSPCRFTASSCNTQIIPDSSDEGEPPKKTITNGRDSEEPPKEFTKERTKDLSLEVSEGLPMNVSKDLPMNVSKDLPMDVSKDIPMNVSKDIPMEISKNTPKQNVTANISRVGKKKLLPLHENLELVSFSPLSPAVPSPKKPIAKKIRRRLMKRKAARAVAAKRIESMREDDEDEAEPGCSNINGINTGKEKQRVKKPRKIISKKIVVKKIVGMDVVDELEALRRNASDRDSTAGRSSLNEFSKKKTLPISGRQTRSQKLVIVATGFSKGDVDLVKSVVKDLGGAELHSTVSRRTTHVVSTGVRTINLLRGIIRGCWLVSLQWVLKSLENHKWLNAEEYEMVHFSKAVQENRRDRQLFGKAYVPDLFTTCGPIYIERGTSPPTEILKELVKTAGGRITENLRDSKLIVGSDGLREIWILDSITTGDLQPIEDYQRK